MRSRFVPFLPYAIASIIHLVTLLVGSEFASTVTKPFLMPTLLFGLLILMEWGTPTIRHGRIAVVAAIAILFSLIGDVLLKTPDDLGFLLGLGCFLLTHTAYLVLFLGPLRQRRIPLIATLYAVWWVALLLALVPLLGSLIAVVAVYGLVLGASSAAALGTNRLVAVGALLFLFSDSVLALKFFAGLAFYPIDFVIMVLYIAGQGLIAIGIAASAQRAPRPAGQPAEAAAGPLPASAAPGDNL
jgi:uncharacterized membrane protein YhhN